MKTEIEINLTPEELAELFIRWDSNEQSKFINLVGDHFKKSGFDSEGQCCWIAKEIEKNGRDFIYTLANFMKVRCLTWRSPKHSVLIDSYPCDSLSDEYYQNLSIGK